MLLQIQIPDNTVVEPSAPSCSVYFFFFKKLKFQKLKENQNRCWLLMIILELFRTSLPTSERAITLGDITKLARRKASHNCEEPLSQKHYVITNDKLPVEELANQAIVKDNGWTTDDWAYLEQLMELDAICRLAVSHSLSVTMTMIQQFSKSLVHPLHGVEVRNWK
uniref:Uncharacterized protein n=1 Tax=Wuchereria bancrofti TaxID=6293 RepID=A0AAF5PKR9_WUCBA